MVNGTDREQGFAVLHGRPFSTSFAITVPPASASISFMSFIDSMMQEPAWFDGIAHADKRRSVG